MPELNKIYYKLCWLLGQKVQHSLLHREGIEIPHFDDLRKEFDNDADMLNYRHEKFGCEFDFDSKLIVRFKGESYEIFDEIKSIISFCKKGTISDAIAFDDRGIDFPKACQLANVKIVEKIASGNGKEFKIKTK